MDDAKNDVLAMNLKKNTGLNSPVDTEDVVAYSSTGSKSESSSRNSDLRVKALEKSFDVLPWLIKTGVIVGLSALGGYLIYRAFTTRFEKWDTKSGYPNANITDAEASTRANALFQAMLGAGNDINAVADQLIGLNYNAFVKVYNAFGKRQGVMPFSKNMTLTEWIVDEFDGTELSYLRGIMGGFF
ncbi:hypothetical protein [Flavobacterium cerinum]|uniref:DUF4359 domain-containing protein n=1 Tax=Flavobacterium cerinum TaxID=2502784 RepID=A0ABY5IRV2_9FLAO|nr:hypothetical protein [Flavobacterium cerinum]UUC45582.1 hypothetical protein NOX80_18420 [Flavobacterium cerinum]